MLVDIVTLLQKKSTAGTAAEKAISKVILADLDAASKMPIASLAKLAGVSEPTVSRLAVSLGLSGTRELKLQIASALAIGGAYLNELGETVSLGEGESLAIICNYAVNTLNQLKSSVTEKQIVEIAGYIAPAQNVQIFGTGGISSMVAQELEFRLFRLGKNVVTQVDGRLQRMTAAMAKPGTVIFGFSLSGGASSVIDSLSIGRQYGATTIAITPPDTPLSRIADHVIPYRYVEDGHVYKPNSARFALLALIDAISFKTAEIIGPEVLENLRRIKQTLTIAENYGMSVPLGD